MKTEELKKKTLGGGSQHEEVNQWQYNESFLWRIDFIFAFFVFSYFWYLIHLLWMKVN